MNNVSCFPNATIVKTLSSCCIEIIYDHEMTSICAVTTNHVTVSVTSKAASDVFCSRGVFLIPHQSKPMCDQHLADFLCSFKSGTPGHINKEHSLILTIFPGQYYIKILTYPRHNTYSSMT